MPGLAPGIHAFLA